MKKIINYIVDFLKEDYNFFRYFASLIILSLSFYLYYFFKIKDYFLTQGISFSEYYLGHLVLLFATFYIISIQKFNIKYLLFVSYSVIILYLNYETKSLSNDLQHWFGLNFYLSDWFRKTFINFQKAILLILPLIISFFIQRRSLPNFYGLSKKNFEIKPYLMMILIMFPIVFIASFEPSFQNIYPRYKPGIAEEIGIVSSTISIGVFESTYWLRFLGVEVFWRGFLVIGGVLLFGRKAILPAACLYSIWHFGKPMGEAIGAFFGAYILGILAYRTKSIYGGIAIHYGVALLMELAAWSQILLF